MEECKYYLKHKWINFKGQQYLKYIGGEYTLHNINQSTKHKIMFTNYDIKNIENKFNINLSFLTGFVLGFIIDKK